MDGLLRDQQDRHESTPVGLLDAKAGELVPSSPFAPDDEPPDILAVPSVADQELADEGAVAAVPADKPTSAGRLEANFSRDLIDTYFRQMGNAELLSREQEVALAKRIEAAQLELQKSLFAVPLAIELVQQWGHDVLAGSLRVGNFVDFSMRLDEDTGLEPAIAEPAAPIEAEEDQTDGAGEREALLLAEVSSRLQSTSAVAREIAALSGKRVNAAARGRELSKRDGARLRQLVATFTGEMEKLRLHPDRIADLIDVIEPSSAPSTSSTAKLCSLPHAAALDGVRFLSGISAMSSIPIGPRNPWQGPLGAGGCSRGSIPSESKKCAMRLLRSRSALACPFPISALPTRRSIELVAR